MHPVAIIPARNEEQTVGSVVAGVLAAGVPHVIVVDNGSTDATAAAAAAAGAFVVAEPRPGYGRACAAGATAAGEADILVFLDADASDRPEDIAPMLAAIDAGADLALVVRHGPGVEPGSIAPAARFGNALCSGLMSLLWGRTVGDLSPLKAIRGDVYRHLAPRDSTYGWTVELLANAVAAGVRIAEVDGGYRHRGGGKSKVSGDLRASARAGLVILRTLFRVRLRSLDQRTLGALSGGFAGSLLLAALTAWLALQAPANPDIVVAAWLAAWPVILVTSTLGWLATARAARGSVGRAQADRPPFGRAR